MHISFLTRQIRLDSYMVIRNYICREIAAIHYETFQNTPNRDLLVGQLENEIFNSDK
jgi:hypothetical protein